MIRDVEAILASLVRSARAILLDFDGTMVDSEPLHFESFRRVFAEYGVSLDEAEYWERFTHRGRGPTSELRRRGLPAELRSEIQRQKNRIFSELVEHQPPPAQPGARELLVRLRDVGFVHAIASNSSQHDVAAMLKAFELPWSPPIVGRGARRKKPHPDIFLAAAESVKTAPQDCLVFEDTGKGLRAAQAAGCLCIVVPSPQTRGFEFPGAECILPSLEPVVQLIRQQTGL